MPWGGQVGGGGAGGEGEKHGPKNIIKDSKRDKDISFQVLLSQAQSGAAVE